jgi:iron complex outermembrane recepter protein
MQISTKTSRLWRVAGSRGALAIAIWATPVAAQDTAAKNDDAANHAPDAEIVVTGTSIKGVAPVGSQLIQVGQADIIERGVQSTAGLLATIPQLDSFISRPTPETSGRMPITPPSLRGLGPGATLSLLNSHRLAGIGTVSTTSDPTSLPIAAIARIEVVPDGASAIYGSDAVGGVINVILRKDLNGVDARASVGLADGYTEQVYSVVGGKTWSSGSVLLGVQYQKNSALLGGERDYITDNFTSVGGGDHRTFFAALPNVTTPGGVTYGYTGNGTGPAAFGSAPNLVSPSREGDLIPGSRKWSAVLNAEQHVGDYIRLFADAHYGNLHTDFRNSPGASGSDSLNFTITNANPYFQTPVAGVTSLNVRQGAYQIVGQYHDNNQDLEYWGVNGGAEVELSKKWSARISANYAHTHTVVDQDTFDGTAFAAAVASTDPATAYDPFTGRTSPATLARIRDAIANPGSAQRLLQVSGAINGSLFALPGGDVKIAIGGEYRREWYDGFGLNGQRSAPVTTFIHSKRNVWSAYGEAFLPVIGEDSNIPGVRRLDFTAALRHDRYSDFGNTTNPKFGANWEVINGLTLRGTYGKSFHAPQLSDLKAIDDLYFPLPSLPAGIIFTPHTGGPYNVVLLAGGNPNLKPEKATTWSLGADYNPTFAPHLRLNATYFDINYTDLVVVPFDKAFVTPALTQLLVTPGPFTDSQFAALTAGLTQAFPSSFTPAETSYILDARRRNLGGSHVKGMDFNAVYRFELGQSKLVADVNGTHFFSKKTLTAPGTPPLDDLATTAFPAWRFRTHVGWQLDRVRANVTWSHLGDYNNPNILPVQRVRSFNPVDLNVSYKLPSFGVGKTFEIQLDIQNVFDEAPPALYSGNGASPLSSPIGRMFEIGLRATF